MSLPIVSVNNVSKSFKVSGSNTQAGEIGNAFWALRDISFNVSEGEILGVIGKNGSGKSTLLKILSNIVKPSSGTVTLRGNVTSILEVGSGFHPELTGIENIFFYGNLLGISRKEMRLLSEEIIDFSEIGPFANEQVKNYSSGMYLRLAFSVVLHARISTLIVDEVLAVGDAGFKKKTFDKISSLIKKNGISVIMVSHGMNDVLQLCNRCIYLNKGEIADMGEPNEIINRYLVESTSFSRQRKVAQGQIWKEATNTPGNEQVRLIGVSVSHNRNEDSTDIFIEDEIFIEIDFVKLTENKSLYVTLVFYDALQTPLFFATSLLNKANENIEEAYRNETGRLKYICYISSVFNIGHYSFQVKFGQEGETEIYIHEELFHFTIKKKLHLNYYDIRPVILRPIFEWKHQKEI